MSPVLFALSRAYKTTYEIRVKDFPDPTPPSKIKLDDIRPRQLPIERRSQTSIHDTRRTAYVSRSGGPGLERLREDPVCQHASTFMNIEAVDSRPHLGSPSRE